MNAHDGPVIYSYDVCVKHYPEMAVRYWLEQWNVAWEQQEYFKRHESLYPNSVFRGVSDD